MDAMLKDEIEVGKFAEALEEFNVVGTEPLLVLVPIDDNDDGPYVGKLENDDVPNGEFSVVELIPIEMLVDGRIEELKLALRLVDVTNVDGTDETDDAREVKTVDEAEESVSVCISQQLLEK